jgi:CHU_C Type IX secretion signal domain
MFPFQSWKNYHRLHALLFGPVQLSEFTVYSRWGRMLYRSCNTAFGWDGRPGGELLGNGVYVWACRYQLQGEDVKMEKGTVLLPR